MVNPRVDEVAAAAMKVQALRDQLASAEAALEAAKRAATEDGAPAPVPPTAKGEGTLRDRVRRLMADGAQRTTAATAEAVGAPQNKVGDAMKRLEQMQELKRVSTGRYVLRVKAQRRRTPAKGTRPPRQRV